MFCDDEDVGGGHLSLKSVVEVVYLVWKMGVISAVLPDGGGIIRKKVVDSDYPSIAVWLV